MTGHVNPTLPIAARLVADGHEVTYHLPVEYAAQVRAVGARLAPLAVDPDGPHVRTDDPVARFALVPAWLAGQTERALPQLLATIGDTRPDVIVYDMTCVWGKVLARLRPGRTAMVVGSYVGNEHFSPMRTPHYRAMGAHLDRAFAHIGAAVARLNAGYALDLHPRELFARDEELMIVVMPRAFHPAGDTFDGRYRFVGACLRDETVPDGEWVPPDETRPRLFVSMGTVLSLWPELVEACYDAFGDSEWQVVFAVGAARVPPPPPNIVVRRAVPQLRLLSTVDAFVTHGGTNS